MTLPAPLLTLITSLVGMGVLYLVVDGLKEVTLLGAKLFKANWQLQGYGTAIAAVITGAVMASLTGLVALIPAAYASQFDAVTGALVLIVGAFGISRNLPTTSKPSG